MKARRSSERTGTEHLATDAEQTLDFYFQTQVEWAALDNRARDIILARYTRRARFDLAPITNTQAQRASDLHLFPWLLCTGL